jgi:quercetin dioxygenase-like cupin family protein
VRHDQSYEICSKHSGALFSRVAAPASCHRRAAAEVLFEHDLPDVTLKNWSVTAVEVAYAPGQSSAAHRHPGYDRLRARGRGSDRSRRWTGARLQDGEMFFENPRELHAVSGNASATKPARLLAHAARKGRHHTRTAANRAPACVISWQDGAAHLSRDALCSSCSLAVWLAAAQRRHRSRRAAEIEKVRDNLHMISR